MEQLPEVKRVGSILEKDGKYSWISERPMMKSLFLLMEVWKVLCLAACIIILFMAVLNLIEGDGWDGVLSALKTGGIVLGILLVISLPAYLIVTRANNGKYTVLFEMDEKGIDHTQIKTEKAKALDMLTVFLGGAANQPVTTAAGVLSASGGSLHSDFAKVRKIILIQEKNMIKLNEALKRNQVYTDSDDFRFVCDYIIGRCPNAKVAAK